ncbi:MAG: hypothetical protein ABEH43_00210 [Flavobacteriales bacterium]
MADRIEVSDNTASVVIVGLLAVIGGGFWGYFQFFYEPPRSSGQSNSATPAHQTWAGAHDVCKRGLKKELFAPANEMKDSTIRIKEDIYKIKSYVNAENRNGAKSRKEFICVAKHKKGKTWEIQKLKLLN